VHPISYVQAIVLGALQGATELFPVSSLGHSVILPGLLGWDIHQNDDYFLTFLIAAHLATALVLLGFFWRDWVGIVHGLGRSLRDREIGPDDSDARLGWLLVVGTIPAGLLGLILEHPLRKVFASPISAAVFLTLNGLMLFGAERLRRRAPVVEHAEARTSGSRAA
jgi:undecaprenyl-diphosphatase